MKPSAHHTMRPLLPAIVHAAFSLSLLSAPALASQAAPMAPAVAVAQGNPTAGRALVYSCQGCHGISGYKNAYPRYRVPKIGGQSAQYLSQALLEYRLGKRKHPSMQVQAQGLSEQDIADIAAYLSTLK